MSNSISINDRVKLRFYTLQDISTQQDKDLGRQLFVGQFYGKDILKLSNHLNVRGYKSVKKSGEFSVTKGIHKNIYDTCVNAPKNFNLLNNGLKVYARGLSNDGKQVFFTASSTVNGGQTQGVLSVFYEQNSELSMIGAKTSFTDEKWVVADYEW